MAHSDESLSPSQDEPSSPNSQHAGNDDPWQLICEKLKDRVGHDNFRRWFGGARARVGADGHLIIDLPNPIHHLWIESNYQSILADVVTDVMGAGLVIDFNVSAEARAMVPSSSLVQKAAKTLAPGLPANGSQVVEDRSVVLAPSAPIRSFSEAGLNARHNFDSFVVGTNSSYSAAVARAVAEKPGRIYNPLFFYGATGLGKTHLMQAIGQEVLLRKKRAVVRYVTSEQFTNEFVDSIRKNTFTQFRQRYRKVDVLLIDDVHFFAGKDSTQEEFFHTFNELFNNAKQIVLASDRPPSEIKNLESRLVSRFEWGLTTQIQGPDLETRVAILRRKQADYNVTVEPWIIDFVAKNVRNNVRKLEGALMRVAAHLSLEGGLNGEPELAALLGDILEQEPTKAVTVDRIQRTVANQYDLRVGDLTGPRRPKHIAEARQVAMYLTRQMTKLPLMQIGEEFGGRDHGTVIHACKVVAGRMGASGEFGRSVDELTAKILAD
ncbi:MAG: chromosomal replication initiator protein DnaA [Verrucomicrobiales bacterium]|nr:chromosomal replication initiator protein DnaA [Verrucomicrobiales bacterium]MCP5560726.1 chromosomal replication initiator protein DnaA [Verrucomicrobiaceae bacterium]